MTADFLTDELGKTVPVNGQGSSRRNFCCIGAGHNQRTGKTHFLMHQPNGIMLKIVRTERIGTNQLGKVGIFVSR